MKKTVELYREGVSAEERPAAQIRQSQLISVFGPGALVDFVKDAAIIAGLSYWAKGERIVEDRLTAALARAFASAPGEPLAPPELFAPPLSDESLDPKERVWIKAFAFPEWSVCQNDRCWEDYGYDRRGGRAPRRLLHRRHLTAGAHRCDGKNKKSDVQPLRFVRACRKGHVDDIDWPAFVHFGKPSPCNAAELWLEEAGVTGDLSEVRIFCATCNAASVQMSEAEWHRVKKTKRLGDCPGKRPWIGDQESCDEVARLLLRSASHAYFSLHMSAIHVPDAAAEVRDAVGRVWDLLKNLKSAAQVEMLRELQDPVKSALEEISGEAAFAEVVRRREGQGVPYRGLKSAEIDAFLRAPATETERFHTEIAPLTSGAAGPLARVARLVLAPRLVEVRALVGFTRFEARTTDPDGDVDIGVEVAPLDASREWLPAIENKGEGFFFSLDEKALFDWEHKNAKVTERQVAFSQAFKRWKAEWPGRDREKDDFSRVRFVLLHSLSHLLITALSLECGYAASAIRERIYAGKGENGILLYTASPGAEGSLGGLVEVGRRLDRILEQALELSRLCGSDPLCAAHAPGEAHDSGDRLLSGAACHACLLISETSCERMNRYLDRSLVTATLERSDLAFFR